MSASRNKENYRPSSSVRARSSIPSLIKSPEKEEVFTNSFLGLSDASQTSLIPSPQKASAALSKPRRKVATKRSTTNLHDQPRSISRTSQSNSPAPPSSGRQTPSARSLGKKKSYLPVKRVSTPPPSSDVSSLPSPASTVSSPPRALTDVYQRIEQEADLADTEGQISDPDDLTPDDKSAVLSEQQNVSRALFPEAASSRSLSRGPTPTQDKLPNSREGFIGETVEVKSDHTGMSFFDQMEDRELAAKLTPMALDSARDSEALRRQWSDQKPIAFGKAGKSSLNGGYPAATASSPTNGQARPIAFGKANKIRLPSELAQAGHHQRTYSDVTDRIDRQTLQNGIDGLKDAEQNGSRPLTSLPLNPRLKRPHYFSRTHGFPARSENISRDRGNEAPGTVNALTRSDSSLTVSTQHSDPTDYNQMPVALDHNSWLNGLRGNDISVSGKYQHDLPKPEFNDMTQASSEIDWNGAAADVSLPVAGTRSLVRSRSLQFNNQDRYSSPIQPRRWENDFTGNSFQVSESPPVRNRVLAQDYSRDREIEGVAKAAVTTNRLSQLRERESQESLRRSSKLPLPQTSPRATAEPNLANTSPGKSLSEEQVNSPVGGYRRLSTRKNTSPKAESASERPSSDRSNSYDLLQRIAKESGLTPKSSPSPGTMTKESISKALGEPMLENKINRKFQESLASKPEEAEAERSPTNPQSNQSKVEQTPRVVGAWTDTVLPDTIKTMRQPQKHFKYAQTPHVNAGGWVETPFVPGQKQELPVVAEDSQEISDIPEELMNGIAKDSASDRTLKPEVALIEKDAAQQVNVSDKEISSRPELLTELPGPDVPATEAPITEMPKSIAQKLLSEQKQKHENISHEKPVDQDTDTLNLGNATIQSLEDLLDMDDEDLTTTLSRLGDYSLQFEAFAPANLSEAEVLERLGSKLDRLRSNIHDARKGITKLEHQVSESQEAQLAVQIPNSHKPSTSVKQLSIEPDSHTSLPATLLNLILPIHLLFRPRRKDLGQRFPRLTLFGWLTVALWSWYFLESLMCELYSHPQYAEVYVWPTEPEPSFPFVLPTMIWRWCQMDTLQPYVLDPIKQFGVGIYRTLAMWAGVIDGFADDRWSSLIATATQAAFGAAKTVMVGDDPDLSMMSDEFL